MRKKILSFVFRIAALSSLAGNEPERSLKASKVAQSPKLDGERHKNYWSNAGRLLFTPQGNEFTARMILFIDSQELKRKRNQS